jgi:hypothetical protein
MTFLSLSWLFDLLAMLHGLLDSNFKICAFVVNGLIKGEIEKPIGQFLSLIVLSHWLSKIWIRIRDGSVVSPLSLFYLENHVCLSRGVQVAGAIWHAATRIVVGVGDLMQRTGDGHTGRVLGGQTIKRSGDTMCGLHRLGWASKPRLTVCQGFDLETTGMVFSGLASKSVATDSPIWPQNWWWRFLGWASKPRWWRVSRFGSQNRQLWFGDLGLKITTTVSLFVPQNQAGIGLLVATQNRWEDATVWDTRRDLVACFAWKQVWPQDWQRHDDGWCTWHHHRGCVGVKLKTDGSMRRATSDPATLDLPFSFYYALGTL